MAYIVNPLNLDVDDDALFMAALSRGDIWIDDETDIEEYPDDSSDAYYEIEDVLYHTKSFILERKETWVNFTHVSQHLHRKFHALKTRKFGSSGKAYKSLVKLLEDFPSRFELRPDESKQGVYWIRIVQSPPSFRLEPVLSQLYDFVSSQQEAWVSFRDVARHIKKTYPVLNLNDIGPECKTYASLWDVVMDYPEYFRVRFDEPGQSHIRIVKKDA